VNSKKEFFFLFYWKNGFRIVFFYHLPYLHFFAAQEEKVDCKKFLSGKGDEHHKKLLGNFALVGKEQKKQNYCKRTERR
jgi:hypothetical protein